MRRLSLVFRPVLFAIGNGAYGGLAGGLLALAMEGTIGAVSGSLRFDLSLPWLGLLIYGGGFAALGGCLGGLVAGVRVFRSRTGDVAIAAGFSGSLLVAAFLFERWSEPGAPGGDGIAGAAQPLAIPLEVGAVGVAVLGLLLLRTRRPRLTRRGLGLLTSSVCAAALIAGAVIQPLPRRSEARPVFQRKPDFDAPNVILIVLDTLRAASLSLYEPEARAHTPNLRAFAEQAVLFENFVAQGSWTKPAFGSMFTSRHPTSHTAFAPTSLLPDAMTTLAEVLLDAGFYTCAFANNPNVSVATNFDQGFVEFIDMRAPRAAFGPPFSTRGLVIFDRGLRWLVETRDGGDLRSETFYAPANQVTRRVLDWLDGGSAPPQAPLHLMIHYMDPHDPYMGGKLRGRGYSSYRVRNPDANTQLEAMREAYEGDIEFVDEHLGALLEGLRQRGLFESSVIIVTSDHGEEFFEHSGWWHGDALYEELVSIPMLIKLPGGVAAGSVYREVASQIDLAPTVLSLVGVTPPQAMTGAAVIDAAGEPVDLGNRLAFSETNVRGHQLRSVRSRNAKLIQVIAGARDRPDGFEYYRLDDDPRETLNLAARGIPEETELRRRLMAHAAKAKEEAGSATSVPELDRREIRRLRRLGYIRD